MPPWPGAKGLTLIVSEQTAQSNVQGSARTTWSGKRCCNDMMIPLQENPTLAIRLGPMAESRLYKIAHPAIFCDLSFVCLIQNSNRPHYWTTPPLSNQISA